MDIRYGICRLPLKNLFKYWLLTAARIILKAPFRFLMLTVLVYFLGILTTSPASLSLFKTDLLWTPDFLSESLPGLVDQVPTVNQLEQQNNPALSKNELREHTVASVEERYQENFNNKVAQYYELAGHHADFGIPLIYFLIGLLLFPRLISNGSKLAASKMSDFSGVETQVRTLKRFGQSLLLSLPFLALMLVLSYLLLKVLLSFGMDSFRLYFFIAPFYAIGLLLPIYVNQLLLFYWKSYPIKSALIFGIYGFFRNIHCYIVIFLVHQSAKILLQLLDVILMSLTHLSSFTALIIHFILMLLGMAADAMLFIMFVVVFIYSFMMGNFLTQGAIDLNSN